LKHTLLGPFHVILTAIPVCLEPRSTHCSSL